MLIIKFSLVPLFSLPAALAALLPPHQLQSYNQVLSIGGAALEARSEPDQGRDLALYYPYGEEHAFPCSQSSALLAPSLSLGTQNQQDNTDPTFVRPRPHPIPPVNQAREYLSSSKALRLGWSCYNPVNPDKIMVLLDHVPFDRTRMVSVAVLDKIQDPGDYWASLKDYRRIFSRTSRGSFLYSLKEPEWGFYGDMVYKNTLEMFGENSPYRFGMVHIFDPRPFESCLGFVVPDMEIGRIYIDPNPDPENVQGMVLAVHSQNRRKALLLAISNTGEGQSVDKYTKAMHGPAGFKDRRWIKDNLNGRGYVFRLYKKDSSTSLMIPNDERNIYLWPRYVTLLEKERRKDNKNKDDKCTD